LPYAPLRSPLARLQVAIGLLRQKPENTGKTLERIERESARLDELVGQLLTLSRLEAGVSLPTETIDLTQLLNDIATDAQFESAAERRNTTLHIEDGLSVVGNHNALQYTPAQSIDRRSGCAWRLIYKTQTAPQDLRPVYRHPSSLNMRIPLPASRKATGAVLLVTSTVRPVTAKMPPPTIPPTPIDRVEKAPGLPSLLDDIR